MYAGTNRRERHHVNATPRSIAVGHNLDALSIIADMKKQAAVMYNNLSRVERSLRNSNGVLEYANTANDRRKAS